MNRNTLLIVVILTFGSLFSLKAGNNIVQLSGEWTIYLDSSYNDLTKKNESVNHKGFIKLPGTTDDANIGLPNTLLPALEKPQVLRLTRKNSFVGKAIYSRSFTLPKGVKKRSVLIKLERVLWESKLKINGKNVIGFQESLSAPHCFDVSNYVHEGENQIELTIDNRKKYDISIKDMAHAYTNETQIMWNGVLGEMQCVITDKVRIENVQVYPDVTKKSIRIVAKVVNLTGKKQKATLQFAVKDNNHSFEIISLPVTIKPNSNTVEKEYYLGNDILMWDEFKPHLYTLTTSLSWKKNSAEQTLSFGMRQVTNRNSALQMNGQPLFLRGTLECAIFPLKGYPPMEKEGWVKVFANARKWGLNHLRFHSWCPPKAAFQVADEMGFYLQIELPLWSLTVNKDTAMNRFLYEEADRIISEYGNHPSFCFWSIGNELQPDFAYLNRFVKQLKTKDKRHLYTATSYTFEKGHGEWPEPEDDFFITQTTKKGWVRGQGIFDNEPPSFNKDYLASVEGMTVPLITHEIGQYAVYPNVAEIEKYTGVLDPLNFKAVKADLKNKGLLSKANDYLMASGKLAAILYKEEIERALKTKGISGFQLLDLHDFPGQGTALVGLLDAFWDSKGLIKDNEFRMFCSPVVPLIRFPKATYTNNETFTAEIQIANYGNEELKGKKLIWKITDGNTVLKQGTTLLSDLIIGVNNDISKVNMSLSEVKNAKLLTISVEIENTSIENSWQIWVYPEKLDLQKADILVTANYKEAVDGLSKGKKVLYSPKKEDIVGLEGKFVQVFWSPVHFPDQPGTMGLLMNPGHPAFANFPTEMHTNWQWWDLCKKSKTICIDSLKGATPIVENVDNFMKNRQLCSVFEAKVDKGMLIFSSMDLTTDIYNRPAAKQLLYSLVEYMKSNKFYPRDSMSESDLDKLLLKSQL